MMRYQIIDDALNGARKYNREQLLRHIIEKMQEMTGDHDFSISKRQFQNDIKDLKAGVTGKPAPIKFNRSKNYYEYTEPDYSIREGKLSSRDQEAVKEAIELLEQYGSFESMKELRNITKLLKETFKVSVEEERPTIVFEQVDLKGIEHLSGLNDAIKHKQALDITYQSFNNPMGQTHLFYPYLLKQYNNRWFLIGNLDQYPGDLTIYALDRIIGFSINACSFREPQGITDINSYFNNLIGVSLGKGEPIEEIVLKFRNKRGNYVLTKKLHSSQEVVAQEPESHSLTIKIKVHPNLELLSKIFEFGQDVEVLSPLSLRERMKNSLEVALSHYQ
ncbi:WYL domain-containing protein (plasmid) [Persicobacter psychrovividus]|uniref:WYL domain-containing protein n=2 Tax=Persicobacter psychrovividus TaxID=387638 RepID=A0ABM7VJH2_9BACT|nr:WYL domain-containing protein [Persicobacter psychrovividus]